MENQSQKKQKTPLNNNVFTVIVWLLIVLVMINVMNMSGNQNNYQQITFAQFIEKVKNKQVDNVVFEGNQKITGIIKGTNNSMTPFMTIGDTRAENYIQILMENGIVPNYKEEERPNMFLSLLVSFLPMILIFGFLFYMLNKAKGAGGLGNFGKIKNKKIQESRDPVKFDDVAGVDESKEDLQEIVEFLKNPRKFTDLGGLLPKGALLIGPPGTGKTMLAKAVAFEAGVPFISISGSDFIEMFVGVGASRVRDLFEQARAKAPCIIFIDEIDAVGKARGSNSLSGGNDEREQTLNQLLVEMDGFDSKSGIIVLAATNRADVLDPALLRPGRLDRRINVPLPDIAGRERILAIHGKKVTLDDSVNLHSIARGTAGFSGADLANLINEATLLAARHNQKTINQKFLEEARDKILMGPERKSMKINEHEKKTTAYHEAGHTILAKELKTDPIHKVTIIPRGNALGVTQTLPEENQLSLSSDKAKKMISMLMGGRIAEELVFNHYTTGASNDIERATMLAKKMVTEWGMSSLGPINYKNDPNQMMYSEFSETTRKQVDDEIRSIIDASYKEAKDIINKNLEKLHSLAQALIEKETLDANEINEILA